MIYLPLLIFGTLLMIFFTQLHNELSAILMGLAAAGFDFSLQWFRFKLTNAEKTIQLILIIFGGLIVRAAFLYIFLRVSGWWFGFNTPNFYLFAISVLITVPVLTIVAAYKFKPKRG